jgi:hypothetical protein
VAITFSLLEKKILPSFFHITTHLLLHVIDELDVCGLVCNKWMYLVDAPPNSLIASNSSPKVKTIKEKVGVHSFVHTTLGVEGCVGALS